MDLIDRQEALNVLFKLYEYQRDIDPTQAADFARQGILLLALRKIEYMPSAQPEQDWIPCSDCERRCEKWEHSKTSQE